MCAMLSYVCSHLTWQFDTIMLKYCGDQVLCGSNSDIQYYFHTVEFHAQVEASVTVLHPQLHQVFLSHSIDCPTSLQNFQCDGFWGGTFPPGSAHDNLPMKWKSDP